MTIIMRNYFIFVHHHFKVDVSLKRGHLRMVMLLVGAKVDGQYTGKCELYQKFVSEMGGERDKNGV